MRGHRFVLTGAIVVLLLASCTPAAVPDISSGITSQVTTYHSPAGWSIDVPLGWHVLPFQSSKGNVSATGVQVSNVKLPSPWVIPGYPMQTNNRVLPSDGIALIVSTDDDASVSPDAITPLPLATFYRSSNGWTLGSAPPWQPYMAVAWFTGHGQTFVYWSHPDAVAVCQQPVPGPRRCT